MTQLVQQARASAAAWPVQPVGRVPLLDVDPDLADGRGAVNGAIAVPVYRFGIGPLAEPMDAPARLGFLVLKGLLLHEAAVCGRAAAELMGPQDILRPSAESTSGTVPARVSSTVLTPAILADLDALEPASAKSDIIEVLAERAAERADRLAIERSIGSHVRVDVRVLAYLWHLADRFGVVVPGGVKLDLPLTHATLARLVGARRPTVTTALQRLIHLGYVQREGRTYLLEGDATAIDDLDQRSPARDFAYPDGSANGYSFATNLN